MPLAAILITVQAVCNVIIEILKFWQTEQGKPFAERLIKSQNDFDAFFSGFTRWVENLFKNAEVK